MGEPTGKVILEKALQHIGEQYVFGTVVPKNDPAWDGPWDCAELVSWCVYQASGRLYGCSENYAPPALADAYTGAWARDARSLGAIITIDLAARVPGAAVLRTGPKVGHIVISDGRGGTVEAMGSAWGVRTGSLDGRRWDFGIMVPWIDYEQLDGRPPVPVPGTIYRLTLPYMTGDMVRRIQVELQSRGYYVASPDGVFGPKTQSAVVRFQADRGLVVDGEVGPMTLQALGVKL